MVSPCFPLPPVVIAPTLLTMSKYFGSVSAMAAVVVNGGVYQPD